MTVIFRYSSTNTKNSERRPHWNQFLFIEKYPLSHVSLVILFIKYFGFVLSFACLCYIVNSVLALLCQYNNQTFSANHSIITSNCTERCKCHHMNGTECKPLCPIQEDPKCDPHSERIKEFERTLNDTNCTCTEKRCVSGMKTL